METKAIPAEHRPNTGTGASRHLRAHGRVPAIIYGHGEPPVSLSLPEHELQIALERGGHVLPVSLDGQEKQFLIKEVQYDYLGVKPVHLDLARIDLTERVTVHVPLEFRGTPQGAQEGGTLEQHLAEVEVECLVTQIPERIRVRVHDLGLDDSLHMRDLELPPDVNAVTGADTMVCTVRKAAVEVVEEAEEEAEKEGTEPEVIGRSKEEEPGEKGQG